MKLNLKKLEITLVKKICKWGVPEAISQLTTPVTALCYNIMLASLVGDIGVSTFSVLSFIYSLANAILSGVAQGLQPLWGNSYGKKDTGEINWLFRCGIIINLVLSALIYSALFFFDKPVICIFNSDTELVQIASKALPLFSLSFIPMALNLIYTSFLYSTKRTKQSNVIAVSRGIIIRSTAICSIPMLFGKEMIWGAPFIAETITLIIAITITKHTKLIFQ